MSVVLITGCSSGIGLASAAHLAAAGHTVYASARRVEAATRLNALMAKPNGAPTAVLAIDVTDPVSVSRGVEEIVRREGHIDVLVNNAGVGAHGTWEEVDIDAVSAVMNTNFFGALRAIQAVVPHMRARGSGAIINVTSVAGRVWLPYHGPYAASKAALEAASETLAQEVAPLGIRVAIVEPGVVATEMFSKPTPTPAPEAPLAPYDRFRRRLWAFFERQLAERRPPALVAATIERAFTDHPPRLRWVVGEDAEALIRGRQAMTDEEWIRLAGIDDDEAFQHQAAAVFGPGLFG